MEALIAKNITKKYAEHTALEDVSISISPQRIYGLLGPNGAGKTTLIRIINQIIAADEGEVLVHGEKLNQKHIAMIGYLPEERGLYKKMKVGEQLVYLGQLRDLSRKDAILKSKAWTKKLGIHDWWDKKIEDLSKGMAQKIQFISTVLHEPKLIILDEPFSGFDPVNANLIKDEILELREKGSTIIFSTHRMESVEELCDDIALINKSKLILSGTKKDIKNSYRSSTYIVDHKGPIQGLPAEYIIKRETSLDDGLLQTIIQMPKEYSPNQLLSTMIGTTEVHSFVEKIPSVSEIFISLVEGGSHE